MTDLELLSAANPLPSHLAERLDLSEAERELLERICATPGPRRRFSAWRGGAGRRLSLRRRAGGRVAVLVAATAAVAVALAVLPSGHRDGAGPAPAFAQELVRFANASPLVLLDAPGWHVIYANEDSAQDGELRFVRGPATADGLPKGMDSNDPATFAGLAGALNWRSGRLSDWVRDRAASASLHTTMQVLGARAQVFRYAGTRRGYLAMTALWSYHGRVLEFGAPVKTIAMFKAELGALRQVDTVTWLRALPPSVIKAAARGATIRTMLKGIPLPPGFDATKIRGGQLVKDRYQLGAAVTGTVACTWIADWARARSAHDDRAVKAAIAAMATAPRWPILQEMARQGAYPEVLIAFARAMPSGRWYGRPLVGDADSGLGCSGFGVTLPGAPQSRVLRPAG